MEALGNHPDVTTGIAKFRPAGARDVGAGYADRAAVGPLEARDAAHEGAFPSARKPDDALHRAGLRCEGHAIQRRYDTVLGVVTFTHVGKFNCWHEKPLHCLVIKMREGGTFAYCGPSLIFPEFTRGGLGTCSELNPAVAAVSSGRSLHRS